LPLTKRISSNHLTRLQAAARHGVWVDVDDMQIVEDIRSVFGHIVMQALCA